MLHFDTSTLHANIGYRTLLDFIAGVTFRSNHYIVVGVLLLWKVKISSLIHISHLHTVQGHFTSSLVWNILHLGSMWWTGWVDKKTLQMATHRNMAADGILRLPVTDKSLTLQMVFAWLFPYSYTQKNTIFPTPRTSHSIPPLSPCSRFGFDLRVWGSAAIRLCDDQGHPGTCLLVWNDGSCHGFKWQPDGSVSSAGSRHRHD